MADKSTFGADPEKIDRLFAMGLEDSSSGEEQASVTSYLGDLFEKPGSRIGRYKLLSVLGEGGMGIVYLAEQEGSIRRRSALKVIKPGMDSKRVIARFETERQALALLDHANIAHVHDAGTTESGRPYFVMEYVKGLPITEYCDRNKLTIEDRLKLFLQVCNAVQHAHQKGIIHRDIKPSNILVSVQEDKAIPKIIDFGVAKAISMPLTDKTLFTEDRQLLGTPEYMSPEQADTASEDIDTRSDIYSLGVLLYELLTGVLPFDSTNFREGGIEHIRKVIRENDPKTPSTRLTKLGDEAKKVAESRRTEVYTLARCLHRELEWIPLKAMRKERSQRYRSASEFADDIENYLNGNPLIAGPPSAAYRVKKFMRRHKALVTGAAAVLAVLLAGIFVSTIFGIESNRQKQIAEEALENETIALNRASQAQKVAQDQRDEAVKNLYFSRVNLACQYYLDDNVIPVRKLLKACPIDLRGWEWDYLWRASDQSIMTLRGHEGSVNSIALSPDGSRIVSGGIDGTIRIWNTATGELIMPPLEGHEGGVRSVTFNHDGSRIVSGSADANCMIWDAESGKELLTLEGHTGPVNSVAFNHDGSQIVSGSDDSTVKVWDAINGGEPIKTLEGHTTPVTSIAISSDGSRIVSASAWGNGTIRIWDAVTIEPIMPPIEDSRGFTSVAISPDGRRIASGCGMSDTTIKVWDTETGSELKTLEGHRATVTSVAFSHDGERIVSGSNDGTIKVWDANNGGELLTLMGHEDGVQSVAFSHDSKRIVSGSIDNTLKVWDSENISETMNLKGHEGWVDWVTFSPDGKKILSGSYDGTLKLWDPESASEVMTLWGHQATVHSVAFSPDGKRIVSGCHDGTLKLWDAESGKELRTLTGHDGRVYSVAFSPDSKRIVSACTDRTIKVWNANSGDELMTFEATNAFSYVAFSPDGSRIVSAGGVIKVWDAVNGGEPLKTLQGYRGAAEAIVFSPPDGRRIVSGGEDMTIKIWDANSGDELMALRGHNNRVLSIVFSPDPNGSRIVSGSLDGTVKVWDATTGAELVTLRAGSGVLGVAFSPNGKTIAAARQHDNAIILWDSKLTDDEYEARKIGMAATKLVDELHEKHEYYKEVITQLNTDSTLDEQTRKIALQVANSRLYEDYVKDANEIVDQLHDKHGYYCDVINELQIDKTIDESILKYALQIADFRKKQEADVLNLESWEVVCSPDNSIEEYQTVLEKAQKANNSEPNDQNILKTLGVAHYRVGDYEKALETLTRSDKMQIELNQSSHPSDLAFIAMSLYKLNRKDEAKVTLAQLQELCEDDLYSEDREVQAFLAEAQKLIEGE